MSQGDPRLEGLKWTSVTSDSSGQNMAATALGSMVWTSKDSGATWSSGDGDGAGQSWLQVASDSSGQNLAAVTYGGDIWTSHDYGQTFIRSTTVGAWRSVASNAAGSQLSAVEMAGDIWTATPFDQTLVVGGPGATLTLVYVGGGVFEVRDATGVWTYY